MKISRSSDKDWNKDLKTQEEIRKTTIQAPKEQNNLSFREEMGQNAEAVYEYLSGRYSGGVGSWLNYMSNTPRDEMYAFVSVKSVIDIGIKVMEILAKYRLDEGYELLNEIEKEHKVTSVVRIDQLMKRGLVVRLDGQIKQLTTVKRLVSGFVDDLAEAIVIKGLNEYKRDYSFMLWAEEALEIQHKTCSYCRDVIRLCMIKNGLCEPEGLTISLSGVYEDNKGHAVYENLQKPILYPSLLCEIIPKVIPEQVNEDDTASESERCLESGDESLNKPRRCMGTEKAKSKRKEKTRKPFTKLRDLTPTVSTCRAWLKPNVAGSRKRNEGLKGNKFVNWVVHKKVEQGYEIYYKYPWKADKADKVVLGERGFSRSC
ncbi:hypothetical protein SteCoe_39506 [Stentor coeruleus]|uniref:Uncharacterized protein n=1 Tax=Stentor coeruleus TaxID=5963 RepID=A0A1R2AKL0_9CILI|nr:hypothetical protein SteCoe_39506 [Stentor coeruleus]